MKEVFAKRLNDAMDLRGIGQGDLATRLGMSQANVSCWVNGKHTPTVSSLFEICEILNVDPNFLMGYSRGIKV